MLFVVIVSRKYSVYESIIFLSLSALCPIMGALGNIHRYYIYGMVLPVYMVFVAVEAVYKLRSSVFVCDSNSFTVCHF
jgi:hypothetical protein